ncbi:MAG: hypothetical protein ACTSVZ_13030 [Promethearchaeota archaeon]
MDELENDSLDIELGEINIDTIEIDYNPDEVNKLLKRQEEETFQDKFDNLENELISSLKRLRERVDELDLPPRLGKVRGDSNFFTRHKNGLKVYGETVYQNVHLLKELESGTWNPDMKCWFFPYNRKGNLLKMGIKEQRDGEVERSETETGS